MRFILILILFFYLNNIAQKYEPPFYFSNNIEFKKIEYPNNCILICKENHKVQYIYTNIFASFEEGFIIPDNDIYEFKNFGIKASKEKYRYSIIDTSVCVDTLSFSEKIQVTKKNIEFQKWLYSKPYCKNISFDSYVEGLYTIKFDSNVIDYVKNKRHIIPEFKKKQTEFSNEDLILAAHNEYRFPKDFNYKRFEDGNVGYLTVISVLPDDERHGRYNPLCTDDFNQAREWMEKSNERNSVPYIITKEKETTSFYEFTLQHPRNPKFILKKRIFKCRYFDPTIYKIDRITNKIILGKFNIEPLTFKVLKDFIETSLYYGGIEKILSFFGEEKATKINFDVYYLLDVHGDYGPMLIKLYKRQYNLDKYTKILVQSDSLIRQIKGLNETQIRHYLRKKEIEKNPCQHINK